jgi:hypothetical protein
MNASLIASRDSFEPSKIVELQTLDRRINDTNELLDNHIAVTPIFSALQESTLKTVQYTKFAYVMPTNSGDPIQVQMSGKARDYTSIALQSDSLATNKNIHDTIFSNLSLDQQTGTVAFDLVFFVNPDFVHYVNHLPAPTVSSDTTSTGTDTTNGTGTGGTPSSGKEGQGTPPPTPGGSQ